MMSEPTSDHTDIFFWADSHEAIPVELLSKENKKVEPILSFMFHRQPISEEWVRPITWEEFFAVFDIYGLSFIYEVQPSSSTRFVFRSNSTKVELR